jgi:hypothetical protein
MAYIFLLKPTKQLLYDHCKSNLRLTKNLTLESEPSLQMRPVVVEENTRPHPPGLNATNPTHHVVAPRLCEEYGSKIYVCLSSEWWPTSMCLIVNMNADQTGANNKYQVTVRSMPRIFSRQRRSSHTCWVVQTANQSRSMERKAL